MTNVHVVDLLKFSVASLVLSLTVLDATVGRTVDKSSPRTSVVGYLKLKKGKK